MIPPIKRGEAATSWSDENVTAASFDAARLNRGLRCRRQAGLYWSKRSRGIGRATGHAPDWLSLDDRFGISTIKKR
jgi:hypothetical protein